MLTLFLPRTRFAGVTRSTDLFSSRRALFLLVLDLLQCLGDALAHGALERRLHARRRVLAVHAAVLARLTYTRHTHTSVTSYTRVTTVIDAQ